MEGACMIFRKILKKGQGAACCLLLIYDCQAQKLCCRELGKMKLILCGGHTYSKLSGNTEVTKMDYQPINIR
jgi:hypothetical protein